MTQLNKSTIFSDFLFGSTHESLSQGCKPSVKILQQRLFVAFVGIAISVLSVFGIVAHYIATEYGVQSELHTLESFAEEKAAALSGRLTGKTMAQANTLLQQLNSHSRLPIILINAEHKMFAATPLAHGYDINQLNQYFSNLPANKRGGVIQLDSGDVMWRLTAVPGTTYRLAIFHSEEMDLSFAPALGNKLFVAAAFIILVTGWVALILASMISHRLDKQNAILLHNSLYDQLTDLPNRNQLFHKLQQSIHHARRTQQAVALLLFELANLKEINDTLGHKNGDALLKQIGPRLLNTLGEGNTIARLEGSEFAILLPGIDAQQIPSIAHKIIQVLQQPFLVNELELETSAAIGAALLPDYNDDPDTLFMQADVAMCLSKNQNHEFFIYTPESDPHSVEQLTLMSELRHAINNNELQLYYQPKIALRSNKVIGVEALLRWFHPQRGLIPPDEFITKAEQTGIIKPLTKWVIEHAFNQSHEWNNRGISLQIAINVSQRSLYDRVLINQIADKMQKLKINNCTLDIEITETAIMAHPEQSMASLQMLHDMGIHLSIDDFGTGFTSLSYLKELPIDELKIDKSFIMSMLEDSKDVMIVRSIIELAHSLGRVVVAEGVESKEILALLQSMNCDTAQGFYMSKPLPANEFEQWLKSSEWNPAEDKSNIL